MKTIFNLLFLLITMITYSQGSTSTPVSTTIPPTLFNAIEFGYDTAGNQILRTLIYIPPRMSNPNTPPAVVTNADYKELNETVSYYPNPVQSLLHLKWDDTTEKDLNTIELYDLNGRVIYKLSNQSNESTTVINFNEYPTGFYVLLLSYNNGEEKSFKIVRE